MNQTNTIIAGAIIVVLIGLGLYLSYSKTDTPTLPTTPPSAVTPTPSAPEAKINIDAVCEGALAYMTFPDGASAEVFVKDCKDGKHPEVIDRYRASLNLDAGVEI